MKSFVLVSLLILPLGTANAQTIYRCPPLYPGKDGAPAVLTGAFMDSGDERGSGTYAPPRDEAAQEGYDLPYAFADDEQAWLVCSYGATRRIKGRVHDGHEWNQRMEGSVATWWMKLAPKLRTCIVQVREIKSRPPGKGTWTATALCE